MVCFDLLKHILYILHSGLLLTTDCRLFITASLIQRVIKDLYLLFGSFARGTSAFQIAEELKSVLERPSTSFYGQNNKSFGKCELASVSELENDSKDAEGKCADTAISFQHRKTH